MFELLWAPEAVDELAALWTQADSNLRQAITAAAHQIDQALQTDPLNQGESRARDERVLFVVPLGVTYDVDAVRRVVRVLQVWRYRPRRRS